MGLLGRRQSTSLFVISESSNTFLGILIACEPKMGDFLISFIKIGDFLLELEIISLNLELAKSTTILGNYCLDPKCLQAFS
jgi:hypothetical protein